MNVNTEAPQAVDLPAGTAAESTPESTAVTAPLDADKPVVRRKRVAKVALATVADGAAAEEAPRPAVEPDGAAADSSADAPLAKPPRRKRAAAPTVDPLASQLAVEEDVPQAGAPLADAPISPATLPENTAAPAVGVDLGLAVDSAATATAVDGDGIPGGALPSTTAGAAAATERDAATGEAPHSRRRERRERRPAAGPGVDAVSGDTAAGAGGAALPASAAGSGSAAADEPQDTADEGDAADAPELAAAPPADVGEVFAQVLSGTFDVDAEPPADGSPALPPKRVLRAEPEAPKLHKVLAQAGVGSRRDMEELILDGHITVNGQPAHIGQRISFGDQIKVKGKPVRFRITPLPARVIAYHKPVGEVVTHDDPQARPTVFRRLPRLQQGKWQSVGRLDINTEGLLLFTNSGELANRLMHPRFGVEREYAVRVLGTLDTEDKAQLMEGVSVDGQTASFRSIEDGGGEGANHWYRVVITEGRNREVRKLFDAVDLTVSRLIRIRYGSVVLPRGLKRGVWVDLDDADVRMIRQLAAVPGDRDGEGGGDGREARQEPRQDPRGRQKNKPDRQQPRQASSNAGGPGGVRRNDRAPSNGNADNAGNGGRPNGAPVRDDGGNRFENRADERGGERGDLDIDDDFDPSRIPNPLEQTFDKRFVQNPRTPAGGRGFRNGGGGFGAGGSAPVPANPKRGDGPRQPDPMQTSVGYIGGDAFHRKGGNRNGGGGGNGNGGGNRGGSGGGNGGNRGGFGGQGGPSGGNRRGR